MKYKGYDIEDTYNVRRYEKVDKFTCNYSNEIELGIEELDELKDLIMKKEAELMEKDVRFSDVKIKMSAVDEQYNPNGADYPAEFCTDISWIEEESEEEREKRIQREKELIDMENEDEIGRKEWEERNRRASLEAAIKVIKENGGIVKNLKI